MSNEAKFTAALEASSHAEVLENVRRRSTVINHALRARARVVLVNVSDFARAIFIANSSLLGEHVHGALPPVHVLNYHPTTILWPPSSVKSVVLAAAIAGFPTITYAIRMLPVT